MSQGPRNDSKPAQENGTNGANGNGVHNKVTYLNGDTSRPKNNTNKPKSKTSTGLLKAPLYSFLVLACIIIVWRTRTPPIVICIALGIAAILLMFRKTSPRIILAKLAFSGNIVYGAILLYFLVWCANDVDVRSALSYFDPTLKDEFHTVRKPLKCDILTPNDEFGNPLRNVMNQMLAPWVGMHTFAWMARYLVIRNGWTTWIISGVFEIFELTFRHVIPDFDECWWDHIFVDMIVCNGLGILLGKLLVWLLGMETYEWRPFSSWPRFLSMVYIFYLNISMDIWSFFMPEGFHVRVLNPLTHLRVFWWFMHGWSSQMDHYSMLNSPTRKMPSASFLSTTVIVCLELLVVIKFSGHLFVVPPPAHVIYMWLGIAALSVLAASFFIYRKISSRPRPSDSIKSQSRRAVSK